MRLSYKSYLLSLSNKNHFGDPTEMVGQYFPKKTNFSEITLVLIPADKLNALILEHFGFASLKEMLYLIIIISSVDELIPTLIHYVY